MKVRTWRKLQMKEKKWRETQWKKIDNKTGIGTILEKLTKEDGRKKGQG